MEVQLAPIRLAVVDDSAFMRTALARLLEGESRICVVGQAASGEELLSHMRAWRPDVVTLDLSMPGMGGLATLEQLAAHHHVSVIVLSTHSSKDAPLTIEALHRGAVDFIDKQQFSLVDFESLRRVLVEKVMAIAGPPAVSPEKRVPSASRAPGDAAAALTPSGVRFDAVVIGASTGGPPAIQRLLSDLGGPAPVPIAIVQHMTAGFTKPFAERLNTHLPMTVREACHSEPFVAGTVYIAPSGQHLRLRRDGARVVMMLSRHAEEAAHCPSVDVLFESATQTYGNRVIGVELTGMGRDGAGGLLAMANRGGHTIAQDEASCVVYGMPKAAVELGAASEVLGLDAIGQRLMSLLRNT